MESSVIIGCEQMAPPEQHVQAALNFASITESGKQKLQEKCRPVTFGVGEFPSDARGFSNRVRQKKRLRKDS